MISSIGSGMGARDMTAMREKMFQKADTDANGSISKEELGSALKSLAERRGIEAEQPPDLDALYSSLDGNGDGGLSIDEMEGLKDALPRPPGGAMGKGGMGGPSGGMGGMMGMMDISSLLEGNEEASDSLLTLMNNNSGAYESDALEQYQISQTYSSLSNVLGEEWTV